MFNRVEIGENFSIMLKRSREDAEKTKKYMAQAMNRSVKTIENWEQGTAFPTLMTFLEWFEALGLNPMRYVLDFMFPDKYKILSETDQDDALEEALVFYIKNVATVSEKRKLAFNIFGNTGSSWHAQLEMLTAHNHNPLAARVHASQVIYDAFRMAEAEGKLIRTDEAMPDRELLEEAVGKGREAVLNGKNGYSV